MNNALIKGLFSEDLLKLMNEMLDEFILSDYDEEEIYNELKFMNESIRMGLYLLSLNKNFVYLLKRIDSVNKRINKERKEKFIEAFNSGNALKFLATLGKGDKLSLLDDLDINIHVKGSNGFSKLEFDYYNLITDSIKSSQEDDKRDGIDSFLKHKKEDNKPTNEKKIKKETKSKKSDKKA